MLVEHMSLHVPCWALPWLNRGGGCGSKKSKSYTSSCGCEAELGSRFLRGGWRKGTTPLGHATFLGGMVATSKRRGKMARPCYLSTPRHFLPAQLFLVSMATKATFIAMLISKKKHWFLFLLCTLLTRRTHNGRVHTRQPISHLKVQYQNQTPVNRMCIFSGNPRGPRGQEQCLSSSVWVGH